MYSANFVSVSRVYRNLLVTNGTSSCNTDHIFLDLARNILSFLRATGVRIVH